MFNKINIKTLAGIFAILLAIVIIITVYDSKKGERTFKSDLAKIDTANITSITFFPKTDRKGIKLTKKNNNWQVSGTSKSYAADNRIIDGILNAFAVIKAERVATSDKNMWKDFEITDSTGTKVIIEVSNKKVLEFTVGKFSYKQVGKGFSISSYIRLENEEVVYSVQNQLSFFFNRDLNSFRNKTIINGNVNDFEKLTFSYPADSSFTLINENNKWKLNGEETDSLKVSSYLNSIANCSGFNFADEKSAHAGSPVYLLKIEGKNMPNTEISAFLSDSINKFIISSSINKESFFISGNSKLADHIFEGKTKFIKQKKAAKI